MAQTVSVVKVENNIGDAVTRAIDLVGGFTPNRGSKVVIKPNLCSSMRSSESGVTTDVRVVEAVVHYLRKATDDCQIIIVESNSEGTADSAFRRLGYNELEAKYGVQLRNLSKDEVVKLVVPNSKKLLTLEVPETLLFMDHFISIAKMKTQVLERFTGIWKNQFGCIPKKNIRPRLHPFLPEVLFDLNSVYRPDLCLIDGIVGLEGPGPLEGTPKRMDKIVCGKDALSVDIVTAKVMGLKPGQVGHIKYALKHGLKDSEDMVVVGDGFNRDKSNPGRFKFIPYRHYLLYRMGLRLRRIARYAENFGIQSGNAAFALRSAGFSRLVEGEMLSMGSLLKEFKDLIFKVETSYVHE